MTNIQILGREIESADLACRYACELRGTSINRAIVEEAMTRIDIDVEKLSSLHSRDISDWRIKADVLIRLCGSNSDAALHKLAISLASDIILSV
jgi:hypothetical protein